MPRPPAAFLSYVRYEDEHEEGRITKLRQRLEAEVRIHTGHPFVIFQDRQISWGEEWQARIDSALDGSTFFIPIITPSFFNSVPCRQELEQFLRRERELRRGDLVLPIYYVNTPLLNDPVRRAADQLAEVIARRQYVDWRELRFEPASDPRTFKMLAVMAQQIMAALERPRGGEAAVRQPPPQPQSADLVPAGGQTGAAPQQAARVQEEGAAESPADQQERPTHVVDLAGAGNFTSIAAAVSAASPGDRILVRPGRYLESVVIDKPLEIVGDGPLDEIVVRAPVADLTKAFGEDAILFGTRRVVGAVKATGADVFLFSAPHGRIVNLSLRQTGSGSHYAVNVAQGRLDLEGCDITSRSEAAIVVQQGAEPSISRNRIHDGTGCGIRVQDGAHGTLEDNEIAANSGVGIEVLGAGRVAIRRNQVHSGKGPGLAVSGGGRCTIEENQIFASDGVGIRVFRAHPTLLRNRVHNCKASGIEIDGESQSALVGNEVFANGRAGIWIQGGSSPTLRDNEIHGCGSDGISVTGESSPTIRSNRIHDCTVSGISMAGASQGLVEDNDIAGNQIGLRIAESSTPTVRKNRVHDGKHTGMLFETGAQGTVEDNEISQHAYHGVSVHGVGSKPIVRRNKITGSVYGIEVGKGGGTFQENDLRGNSQAWSGSGLSRVISLGNRES